MKGIILFDIDRTLFDTDMMLKLQRREIVEMFGTSRKKAVEIEAGYYEMIGDEKGYNLDEYSNYVGEQLGIVGVLVSELLWNKDIFIESVYPETSEVIMELHNRGYVLGIYSEGPKKFQRTKYNAMKLHKYFKREYVFINEEKRSDTYIKKLPDGAAIVDDNVEVIQLLDQAERDFETYWINRKKATVASGYRTIHSLKDLLKSFK